MTEPVTHRATTRVSRIISAPRDALYQACLDAEAIASWRAPNNMLARVHVFDARVGGTFRVSLTYRNAEHAVGGKSSEHTDTYHGRFIELIRDEKIVEAIEFEFHDPLFAGEMKMTTSFADAEAGTEITILCQNIPAGIRTEDNATGCEQALRNLASFIEHKRAAAVTPRTS